MLRRTAYVLFSLLVFAGCDSADPTREPGPVVNFTTAVPLIDLVRAEGMIDTYKGFKGGLYPDGNDVPDAHAAAGTAAARQVQPLDATGRPSTDGKIVLMSISMSNATREWCHNASTGAPDDEPCNPWTFMGQATSDPALNPALLIANGARGGRALQDWDSPDDAEYERVAQMLTDSFGVSEAQVQVVWVKAALEDEPTRPTLPDPNADAYVLEATIGDVVRALRARYPNIRQVFFTSRIYAGYAEAMSNSPEPWAYETGFSVKWAIEAQINQRATGAVDGEADDLAGSPFMAWGPYLWSYGDHPRSDGLMWPRSTFPPNDGVHPNAEGQEVVADSLIRFFKTSSFTSCWFLSGPGCS